MFISFIVFISAALILQLMVGMGYRETSKPAIFTAGVALFSGAYFICSFVYGISKILGV